MRRLTLTSRALDAFGSTGISITELTRVEQPLDGFAVTVASFGGGATIGRHPTGLWQLFAVVSGSGWAAGSDDVRMPLGAGDAVLWEPSEEHISGTDDGMVVVLVQSTVRPV